MKLWKIVLKLFDQSLLVREEILALFIEELDSKLHQKPYVDFTLQSSPTKSAYDLLTNVTSDGDSVLKPCSQVNTHCAHIFRQNISPPTAATAKIFNAQKTPEQHRMLCRPSAPPYDDVC